MSDFLIYGLSCPSTGEIRYVGKTVQGLERAQAHLRPSSARRDGNTHKRAWLNKLQREGAQPGVLVLETCQSEQSLNEAERWNILYYRSLGNRLTNLTDGGEGMSGWVPGAETKAKWSAALKGKPRSEEVKRKISDAQKGRKKSETSKAAMRQSATKRWQDPKQRAAMAQQKRQAYANGTIAIHRETKAVEDSLGNRYDSVKEASAISHIPLRTVIRSLAANLSSDGEILLISKYGVGFRHLTGG